LKFDGGHGGQNGLRDIMAQLGHGCFHRLRLGIGHPGDRNRVTSWVLGNPSAVDEELMIDAITRSLNVLPLVVAGEFNEAMKRLHTSRDAEPGTRDPD
jgi:PTH1 family peptidyl-tRNA hydrolase